MAIWRSADWAIGRAVLTAVAIGVGVWCSFAALDVATMERVRVAMFPPWWTLAAAIVGAALVASALTNVASTFRWKEPAWRPLLLLSVLALPYLPWVPDMFPVLRALAGPGRWIVWLVAIGLTAWGADFRLKPEATRTNAARLGAVFLVSALIIGAAALKLTGTALFPGGDEPHYLVITQSLLRDGDLRIENNHLREDYAEYFHAPLQPHYLARGVDREIYSVHPVGISLLVAPAFAVAGYPGVVFFLVLLSSLTATLIWWRAFELTGSAAAATFGWAAACVTAPYLFNSFAVYPEVAAAACVLIAFPWNTRAGDLTWLARGVAVAALPWLSSKYVAMAGVLAAVALWRAGTTRRALLVIAPFATSLGAWFGFFYVIWGSPSPTAAYGGNASTQLSTLVAGGPGLWFDQEYGVIAYAPVLMMAMTGMAALPRRLAVEIALVVGALLATVGSFHIWWGGSASPGRPMIAAVPLLAIPIAWQFRAADAAGARRRAQLLLLFTSIGISLSLLFAQEGLLIANDRSGSARVLQWLSIAGELPPLFPSFIAEPVSIASGKAAVWVAVALVAGWVIARRSQSVVAIALAAIVIGSTAASSIDNFRLTAFAKATAVKKAEATRKAEATTSPVNRPASRMLDTFDAARRPIAVVYDPLRRIPPRDVPPLLPLLATRDLWTTRFSLPAGTYRVDLRPFDDRRPPGETLALTVGRQHARLRSWPLNQVGPEHLEFHLPVGVRYLGFRHTPDTARRFESLRIVPLDVVDARQRGWSMPVLHAASFVDIDVFFHDENAFPESTGFWTRGGVSTAMTLYPLRDVNEVTLGVHGGPIANQIRLRAATWEERFDLKPGTRQEVHVPLEGRSSAIRLEITTTTGFVPADVDKASTDRRMLGAWVEFVR